MRFLSFGSSSADRGQKLWPVLVLLMLTVALPTAGMLWFMSRTIQSNQENQQNYLRDICRDQLNVAVERVEKELKQRLDSLERLRQQKSIHKAFEECVLSGISDSVLFCDEKGNVKYPALVPFVDPYKQEPLLWEEATRLEEANKPLEAAEVYGQIAQQVKERNESAEALLFKALCLNKAKRKMEALDLLIGDLGKEPYRHAVHAQGRLLQLDSWKFALEMIKDVKHPLFARTAATLSERLNDYGDPPILPSQRRFLMNLLKSLWPECPPFQTLAAEQMAATFSNKEALGELAPGKLLRTSADPEVWKYQTHDRSVIALFHEKSFCNFLESAVPAIDHIKISALAPGKTSTTAFMNKTINAISPGWQLILNKDPFWSKSSGKIGKYIWTGVMMAVAIAFLSSIMIWRLRRQVRLTRLKNDLIATVSHELKTPLASMRLLVDTLRDGHYQETQLVQEYLELISKENARLSSLIEGFLTFSRMERRKTKFDRVLLRTGEIVQGALEAVGDRLHAPGCRLTLDVAQELPPVIGDRDALTTVLVNLLDNAVKYSGSEKEILLRGYTSNGSVFLEVQDNGIGFSRSAAKKIFDRFYQVDQNLSRTVGGCGLGLSIVQFIVTAHNGSITAKSQPGEGSTFTVQLPIAPARGDSHEQ